MSNPISNPALRYPGGKWRIANWIISHMPAHECYVEPYAGGASVLLRKEPVRFEVLNDLDGDVVNFWRILRERTDDFLNAVELTPWAREEYDIARQPCADPLERARRFYVRIWQGFGKADGTGGWVVEKKGTSLRAGLFQDSERLGAVARRLSHVQIEHRPAINVIARFDAAGTLFYVDPPYVKSTRPGTPKIYNCEMADHEHWDLLQTLHGIKGMAIVSGYNNPIYAEMLSDWLQVSKQARAQCQKQTLECLWINPQAVEALAKSQATQ